MNKSAFNKFLNLFKDNCKRNCRYDIISSDEQIVITLQYLSKRMSMQTIGHSTLVITVQKIIKEACEVLWGTFGSSLFNTPGDI